MQKIDVLKKDYERYLFPIPVNRMLGAGKNKYVFSELEKRHPCFSDEYAFDVVLRPGLKGFFSDVVVIKKMKLAEFKKKIMGLSFEDCREKRFSKISRSRCLAGLFILVVVGTGFILWNKQNCGALTGAEEIREEGIQEENQIEDEEISLAYDLKTLMEIVKNEKGKISFLSWKTSGVEDELLISLKGIYPEKVAEVVENGKISSILYVDDTPEFSYSMYARRSVIKSKREDAGYEFFQQEIRNLIQKKRCNVIEESFSPYEVKFSFTETGDAVNSEGEAFGIFAELEKLLRELNLSVESIIVKKSEANSADKYEVELSVSRKLDSEIEIGLLSLYYELFAAGKSKSQSFDKIVNKKTIPEKLNEDYRKIGEVMYGDGTKLVFYKNQDGKVIKKKESI